MFLKHLQAAGLLSLQSRGGGGGEGEGEGDELRAVNRQHELFRTLADRVRVADPEEFRKSLQASARSEDRRSSGSGEGGGSSGDGVLSVVDLYKFPRPVRELLEKTDGLTVSVDGMYGECLSGSEVRERDFTCFLR